MRIVNENVDEILDRFNSCFDAVIKSINVDYCENKKYATVTLLLETQDNDSSTGWSDLTVSMLEVEKFCFFDGVISYRVLSDGLIIKKLSSDMWGVGFDERQERINDEKDFLGLIGFISRELFIEIN